MFSKKKILRLNEKSPHRKNPDFTGELAKIKKLFQETSLLDPFAGFGSIPLEAIRLNVGNVTAVELLPTAVIFLKAVLEYPLEAARNPKWKNLVEDVKRMGEWIIEQLKNDEDIKELYDEDVAVYIGTWEVKCPICGKYTPLIGNYWLARVKDDKGNYSRIAYMQPKKTNDHIEIEVVDVNKETGLTKISPEKHRELNIKVPDKNIDSRREKAQCLYCKNTIRYIDPKTKQHYTDKTRLPKALKEKLKFYPKYALKQWNQMLEYYLEGKISLEQLKQAPARPRILVKVKIKGKDLEFVPATQIDNEKLWKALEKLKKYYNRSIDIPRELIPSYENRRITPVLGASKWYQFFNPRQLLVLIKLIKLIRQAGKLIEIIKTKERWNKEEINKYNEAITTYLSIILCKYADYNSYAAGWNQSLIMGHSLSMRGIAMMWNWDDMTPWKDWTGTYYRNLNTLVKGLTDLIKYLDNSLSHVKILLDDSSMLNRLDEKTYDIMVTDPPYRDDVPYTELSDFYFVWLKRALSDNVNGKLVPRFHKNVFFRKIGASWKPINTQWEMFAKHEVSLNPGRFRENTVDGNAKEFSYSRYLDLLSSSFKSINDHLVDNGILVTYYNHTSPDAWRDLLWAGWLRGGFRVTATWPLDTESKQSIVRRGKKSLDTSLIVVWRKRQANGRTGISSDVYREALGIARKYAEEIWRYHRGLDAFIGVMGKVLEIVTSYDRIIFPEKKSLAKYIGGIEKIEDLDLVGKVIKELVFPAAARGLIDHLVGVSGFNVSSPEALFYLLFKLFFLRDPETTKKLMGKEKKLDASSMTILSIASGIDTKDMIRKHIVAERKAKGENKKEYVLLSPLSTRPIDLKAFLERKRRINPDKPRINNSIDALHVLEYYAAKYDKGIFGKMLARLREQPGVSSYIDEAKGIAYIICQYFDGDPEQELARKMLEYMGIKCSVNNQSKHATLDSFFKS